MKSYFLKRLLILIPTLLITSIVVFFLAKISPGDPLVNQLENQELNPLQKEKQLRELREAKGLNKPLFYFSIHRSTVPDTAYKIHNQKLRSALLSLAYQHGNWENINVLYREAKKVSGEQADLLDKLSQVKNMQDLQYLASNIDQEKCAKFISYINELSNTATGGLSNYLLQISWHGLSNQYHDWLMQILKGNLGASLLDNSAVSNKLYHAISWTLILSISSLIISFLIAIPIAVYAAANPGSFFDRFFSTLFFGLYALPSFWVATLLIIFFASGDFLNIFPAYGIGEVSENDSFLEIIFTRVSHLFLPLICWTYASLAFLFRQMRNSMTQQLSNEYCKAALAKGISRRALLWSHAFKNTLIPMITILGNVFPAVISGAFVIEHIFNIPGMGKLTIDSFLARDYPTIFAILLVGSTLTLLGTFLADIAYQKADPRISFQASNQSQ